MKEVCYICKKDTNEVLGCNYCLEPVHESCFRLRDIKEKFYLAVISIIALLAVVLWN